MQVAEKKWTWDLRRKRRVSPPQTLGILQGQLTIFFKVSVVYKKVFFR